MNKYMVKDQNVLSFMAQLVQMKFGDEVDATFLDTESNRLYDDFGANLVKYFEPLLTEDQKRSFDEMIEREADQQEILQFLMAAIPELDKKIQGVLIQFRDDYIKAEV